MCKKRKKIPRTLNIGQANSIYYPGSRFDLSQTGFERRINGSRILLGGVSAFRLDVDIDIETKKKKGRKKKNILINFPQIGFSRVYNAILYRILLLIL